MKVTLIALIVLIMTANAWTDTPAYIIARIAEKDLLANDPTCMTSMLALLEPLNKLSNSGNYPFDDAIVFPEEDINNGFSLADMWRYNYSPYFDGVPQQDIETHSDFAILTAADNAQSTIDVKQLNSRIDPTFGKSWNLRYLFMMVGDLHQPMHNIIRYSTSHPDGDNFGKDHKISGSYASLYDIFDDAFGQFTPLAYPLSDTAVLDTYVDQIMTDYPKSMFDKEIADTSKSSWSQDSFNIAKDFAYTLAENQTPSDDYISQGKQIVNKQLAIAGYRIATLAHYIMDNQVRPVIPTLLK